jgi:hypothetical protein
MRTHAAVAAMSAVAAVSAMTIALAGCAKATPYSSSETSMPSQATPINVGANSAPAIVSATSAAPASARVHGAHALELQAEFDYAPASRIIEVRYTLHNRGETALAVFDRGDLHAVGVGRQVLGAVGIPRMETEGDDVSLIHAAAPLPDPAPTSPPTPLAIELAPGASLEGEFKFALKGTAAPKRLRWCVGAMPMGEAYMDSPQSTRAGRLWRASFGVVEKQNMICTPWYDVASAAFEREA